MAPFIVKSKNKLTHIQRTLAPPLARFDEVSLNISVILCFPKPGRVFHVTASDIVRKLPN